MLSRGSTSMTPACYCFPHWTYRLGSYTYVLILWCSLTIVAIKAGADDESLDSLLEGLEKLNRRFDGKKVQGELKDQAVSMDIYTELREARGSPGPLLRKHLKKLSDRKTVLHALFWLLKDSKDTREALKWEELVWATWTWHSNRELYERLQQAEELVNREDQSSWHDALDMLNHIIDQDPLYSEAWNKRATLWYQWGEEEKCLSDVDSALRLEPRHFFAFTCKGLVQMQRSLFDEAIKSFQLAQFINPFAEEINERIEIAMRAKSEQNQKNEVSENGTENRTENRTNSVQSEIEVTEQKEEL
eukprot:gnl/MRDRNA2_/MRDRNA2_44881_c0_seq1.p1 gnl/MRDRNA2_/MRDRNA2_44881_c0~~gnl/MRDRNA2_/MRDRNA2_44881_c0_seq1.p1  ORF type:complete len:303 (+),score=57.53 gnl/MRDRNA2_/MRDRNA2_44881_c0_seq1:89-997(+)